MPSSLRHCAQTCEKTLTSADMCEAFKSRKPAPFGKPASAAILSCCRIVTQPDIGECPGIPGGIIPPGRAAPILAYTRSPDPAPGSMPGAGAHRLTADLRVDY